MHFKEQAGCNVHPAGKTGPIHIGKSALLGNFHQDKVHFWWHTRKAASGACNHELGCKIGFTSSSFHTPDIGLVEVELKTLLNKVSVPASPMLRVPIFRQNIRIR